MKTNRYVIFSALLIIMATSYPVSAQQKKGQKGRNSSSDSTKNQQKENYDPGRTMQSAEPEDAWKRRGNTNNRGRDSVRSVEVYGTDTGLPARNTPAKDDSLQPDGTGTVQQATYNMAGSPPPSQKTSAQKKSGKTASPNADNGKGKEKEPGVKQAQPNQDDTDVKKETKQNKRKSKRRGND